MSSCAACPAPGNCWRSNRHGPPAGSAEAELASTPPRPADRDAQVGPRRGGNGQADTVDPARHGPLHPESSELNSYRS